MFLRRYFAHSSLGHRRHDDSLHARHEPSAARFVEPEAAHRSLLTPASTIASHKSTRLRRDHRVDEASRHGRYADESRPQRRYYERRAAARRRAA